MEESIAKRVAVCAATHAKYMANVAEIDRLLARMVELRREQNMLAVNYREARAQIRGRHCWNYNDLCELVFDIENAHEEIRQHNP